MKQVYFLKSPQIQLNCIKFIEGLQTDIERYLMVEIKEPTRSLEQSALLHALFGELSKKAKWQGEKLTPEQWKVLMISAHTIATGAPCKLTVGLEGEMVNLRESSAKMSVKRLSSLIEYIYAWCAMNEINLKDINHD